MSTLAAQRCLHHPAREAAVRCPQCRRFFCRECVSEHDDRLLCASCLGRSATTSGSSRARLAGAGRVLFACAGLAVTWLFFDVLGRALLRIPSSFHEGSVWRESGLLP